MQHLASFLFQPFCCRFAGVLGIIVLLHDPFCPSFSCQTDGFTFDSRILWYTEEFMVNSGPVAAKQAQIITPPSTCSTDGDCADMLCLCLALCIMSKHLHFRLHLSKGHCSRSLVVWSDATLQT